MLERGRVGNRKHFTTEKQVINRDDEAMKPVGLPVGFWVDNRFGPGQRIPGMRIIRISATVDVWGSG